MLINLRNALMSGKRLPYDAEVEYLESTGTQWVNVYTFTGSETSLRYNIDFVITQNSSSSQNYILGVSSAGNVGPRLLKYSTNFWYSCDTGSAVVGQPASLNQRYDIDFTYNSDGTIESSINGGVIRTYQRTFYSSQGKFNYLFGLMGNSTYGMIGRVYRMKMWADSILVRDFIPVRKGTVGYLYDRVSGKLFGNAGTGDFVLGPDVVPVEYIESHGTEWIDTGVKGRDGYDFEYRFRPIGPLPLGIGGEYENNKNCYIGLIRSNGNLAYNYYTPNVITEVQSLTLGTDYNIKAHLHSGEQYFEVNGVRGGIGSKTGSFVSNFNLYLFAINNANSPTSNAVMRLHDFTANLNGVPVRKYRPVRVGTEGAMMDVLTRRVYRNAGTGAFGYGNDLKYPIPAS